MTIQRTTNLHSAPISACLRAFACARQSLMALISRPCSYATASIGNANVGGTLSTNKFRGGNATIVHIVYGNSAPLKGSA
jgi:hypothetical protein